MASSTYPRQWLVPAGLVLLIRALYGFESFDGGLTVKAQNAILLLSLLIVLTWGRRDRRPARRRVTPAAR